MANDYDTIIIGGGPGGLAAAYALNGRQSVLVVEGNLWGGTCPNFGCDPKKMLYGVVEAKRQVIRYQTSGLPTAPKVDWPALMKFKHSYTDKIPTGTSEGLKHAGIDQIHGHASFVDSHTLQIGDQRVTGKRIIIATGATPTIPDIPGKEAFQTSTDFLDLPILPKKIGFVGAGYVAIELANIAVEAGAEVHIFQHNDRLLRGFPQSYTEKLQDILSAKGVIFHMHTTVTALQAANQHQVTVITDTEAPIELNVIYTAAGRRPNLDGLNLADIGVNTNAQGVEVDDHLRTSVSTIYAIGDAISKKVPKLTPVSGIEGRYVASQILADSNEPIQYPVIPHTVFAGPELAQVGVTLADAHEHPDLYEIHDQQVGQWYTYHRLQDDHACVSTIVDKATAQLVGAVVLAVNAEELVNDFSEIIDHGESSSQASDWTPVYPSVSSDLGYFY